MQTQQLNQQLSVPPQVKKRVEMPAFLVADDHDAILECLVPALKSAYPEAQLLTAQDCQTAHQKIEQYRPKLAILDLDLPETTGKLATCRDGICLLKTIMQTNLAPNILVLGAGIRPLVRLRDEIYRYANGFAATDKAQPVSKWMGLVDLSLRGSISLPVEVRSQPEFKSKWITLLTLKFQEGLSDKAIAEHMKVCTRTLRSYWLDIQDTFGIYDHPDRDLKVQIGQAARRAGLID